MLKESASGQTGGTTTSSYFALGIQPLNQVFGKKSCPGVGKLVPIFSSID